MCCFQDSVIAEEPRPLPPPAPVPPSPAQEKEEKPTPSCEMEDPPLTVREQPQEESTTQVVQEFSFGFSSYINSSGVRMVEISAEPGTQIPLATLESVVKSISGAAAEQKDSLEVLEEERISEFQACMNIVSETAFAVLLGVALSVYIYFVSRMP